MVTILNTHTVGTLTLVRFREAIHEMTGHRPPYLFYLCWRYLGPLVMAGVFTFYLVTMSISTYNIYQYLRQVSYSPVTYGTYTYPTWAEAIGLGLSLASMVWVPLYALYFLAFKQV